MIQTKANSVSEFSFNIDFPSSPNKFISFVNWGNLFSFSSSNIIFTVGANKQLLFLKLLLIFDKIKAMAVVETGLFCNLTIMFAKSDFFMNDISFNADECLHFT